MQCHLLLLFFCHFTYLSDFSNLGSLILFKNITIMTLSVINHVTLLTHSTQVNLQSSQPSVQNNEFSLECLNIFQVAVTHIKCV